MRIGTRFLLVLALLVASSVVLAGSAAARTRAPVSSRHGTLYLALGDSLAAGYGAGYPSAAYGPGFFSYLDAVGAADTYVNIAVPGESSSSLRYGRDNQFGRALALVNDPRTDVGVVSLSIGGNDVPFDLCIPEPESAQCQAAFAQAMRLLSRNLSTTLQQLNQALAADPGTERVMLTAYYQPFSGSGLPWDAGFDLLWQGQDRTVNCASNAAHPEHVGLNDVISCVGTRYGASIVNLFPLFEQRSLELTHIAEEDIHPNDAGYAVITAALIAEYSK